MGHWNHRVMRRTYISGGSEINEVIDSIHEVYYDADNIVAGWTDDAVTPTFYLNEDDDQTSILDDIKRFERATTMPILDYETGKEITDESIH
jgi:hypothetical protein